MKDCVNIKALGAKGDGITDDSAVINAAIKNYENIYIPEGDYALGSTLKLTSHTHIIASALAHLKLMAGAQKGRYDFLLTNSDYENSNGDMSIDGGIWDSNCGENDRGNDLFDKNATTGTMFNFFNVKGLSLNNMVLKNPLCYYTRFCHAEDVKINNIRFLSDVILGNQDGIHFAGFCKNFVIRNLWGAFGSPNDDFLAFNADDCVTRQESFDMQNGPIENVLIENVYSEKCHCFVRLLCVSSAISNVTIRNVSGSCKNTVINMDAARYCRVPVFKDEDMPNGAGNINNVLLENFSVAADKQSDCPLIALETNCNNFCIQNFISCSPQSPILQIRKTCGHTLFLQGESIADTIPKTVDYNSDITVNAGSITKLKFNRI